MERREKYNVHDNVYKPMYNEALNSGAGRINLMG